jgi:hypothetical protein
MLLQDQANGRLDNVREKRNAYVSEHYLWNWHGNAGCCVSSCYRMVTVNEEAPLSEQAGFAISNTVRCFRLARTSRPPDLAAPCYCLGATLRARCRKWVLPMLMTENSTFGSGFKVSLRKCYNVLYHPFLRDCRGILNDVVVTYKVSYSESND